MKRVLERFRGMDDRTMGAIVIGLFIASCIVRAVLACYPKALMIYPDEIRYIGISRSLFDGTGIMVHNVHMNFDQILYSLLLAPFHWIKDQIWQIRAMSVFNAVLLSSVVFPVHLLGKRILKDPSLVLLLLATTLVLPDLTTSMTFMSENLFYPLAAWLIYCVCRFWDSEAPKDRVKYAILSAVLCFLAYLTKTVAVYFMAAFVASLAYDVVFTKKNTFKQNMMAGVVFCLVAGGAILGFKLIVYLTLGMGAATYAGNLRLAVYDFDTLIYYVYANLYNAMFALIAFFYFPVVIPILRFKRLNPTEKNLLVFAVVSLMVMLLIITTSISNNEDYPNLFMRQHTRYYAPLLLLFLTLFFKERFVLNDGEGQGKGFIPPGLVTFTVFFCMAVFGIFYFFSNVCIDGVLLQALSSMGKDYTKISGDPNVFHVPWQLLLAKSLLVLGIASFTVVLLRPRNRKAGTQIFILLILAVSLLNNVYSVKEFHQIYKKAPDSIRQAIAVNQAVASLEGRILVITAGYEPLLDTYLTRPAYWTKKSDLLKLLEGRESIDLTEQKIISNYPFIPYEDLASAEYIITDNTIKLDEGMHEEIELTDMKLYNLYRSKDPAGIYLMN